MLFGKKKGTVIDQRINELQKEMERVRSELKTASRPVKAGLAAPVRKAPFQGSPAGPVADQPVDAAPVFEAKPAAGAEEHDLFAYASRRSQTGSSVSAGRPVAGGGSAAFLDEMDRNPQTVRKKFANYFMAGHFQNLRPLRQESRIVRNKAIVMIILVLALVLWLIYYLQTH